MGDSRFATAHKTAIIAHQAASITYSALMNIFLAGNATSPRLPYQAPRSFSGAVSIGGPPYADNFAASFACTRRTGMKYQTAPAACIATRTAHTL